MCCHNTDYVHMNALDRTITVILAKQCIELPDYVSTNYIFVHLLDNKEF